MGYIYWRLKQLTTTNNARIVIVITIGIVDNRIRKEKKKKEKKTNERTSEQAL